MTLASLEAGKSVFKKGKYREFSCLHVVVLPEFADELPAVMASLGFERASASPRSIEWRGTFRDEHPVATVRVEKGEVDIRRRSVMPRPGRC